MQVVFSEGVAFTEAFGCGCCVNVKLESLPFLFFFLFISFFNFCFIFYSFVIFTSVIMIEIYYRVMNCALTLER